MKDVIQPKICEIKNAFVHFLSQTHFVFFFTFFLTPKKMPPGFLILAAKFVTMENKRHYTLLSIFPFLNRYFL